jgi:hypothetical protein
VGYIAVRFRDAACLSVGLAKRGIYRVEWIAERYKSR